MSSDRHAAHPSGQFAIDEGGIEAKYRVVAKMFGKELALPQGFGDTIRQVGSRHPFDDRGRMQSGDVSQSMNHERLGEPGPVAEGFVSIAQHRIRFVSGVYGGDTEISLAVAACDAVDLGCRA